MTSPETFRSMWADLRGVEFAQHWTDAGGLRTRYLGTGETQSDPLVFLHGTGGHAEAYVRNLGPHGEHFRTYSLDMVGHGWTDKPAVDLEIEQYVDHLRDSLDALSIDRVMLSGESLGGWVAARFAAQHPDRVRALVLNTAGGVIADEAVMATIRRLSMQAVEDPSWDFVKARLEWLMADPRHVNDDLVATRQAVYAQPGMVEAMRRTLVLQEMEQRTRNLLTSDELASITAPTLVLWTSHDPTASTEVGRSLADMIPGAEYVVMSDCGHWPQFEKPDEFNRLHIDFLQRALAATSAGTASR